MADLGPEAAGKVLGAELRNLVKSVGDGDTLSKADRQVFLDMAAGNLSAEEIQKARVVALTRKHMDGGRLTAAEKDEIAHILGDATALLSEPFVTAETVAKEKSPLTREQIEKIYDLSRAKYFRWEQAGKAVAEGPDSPPFDDPKAMVAWYERMKGRGIFKHSCPKILKDLAARGLPDLSKLDRNERKDASPSERKSDSTSTQRTGASVAMRLAPEERGFLVEHEKLEEHTAILREDYLEAFAAGDDARGAMLKERYFEAYELLRKSAAQKEPIGLSERSIAKVADVNEDLGLIIPAIAASLLSRSQARSLFDELSLDGLGVSFDTFWGALKRGTIRCFDGLVKSKFAPPLDLSAS